jgi:hypothetical protein
MHVKTADELAITNGLQIEIKGERGYRDPHFSQRPIHFKVLSYNQLAVALCYFWTCTNKVDRSILDDDIILTGNTFTGIGI